MNYVELHRWFAPVRKDQEVNPNIGKLWGPKVHGWMDWEALRSYRRVVLLAEASSGKSEEFRHQARTIASEGHPAFYLRIEELADHGLEAALGPQESESFEIWKARASEGWFFLDSVDEARLNRKSFEGALKRFAREVGAALERTHIFVSCRVTDWKQADDRRAIMDWLPAWQTATVAEDRSEHSGLLDPIFNRSEQDNQSIAAHGVKPHELLVVQLVSLDRDQAVKFAKAAGVADTDAFDRELGRGGLEAFQHRPGDILELVAYWNEHKAFGSLDAMIDFGITHMLSESDPFRADSDALSSAKARTGAELLAAALTLGKSFTLRAPGSETDPSLSAGAIDPAHVLDNWSNAERTSLLRRGMFAPATYGRIRFHHRSTQEFLTAKWFDRLLAENCPKAEIWNLIFADRYGVPTIVPSLQPAAAWLALWHPDIRDEIIRREPLLLLQKGAPRSLPIETRQRILSLFAAKHAAGEISDTYLDSRNLAMFADERLSSSISQAWELNDRDEFRFILLRLIRDGTIKGTIEIVRNVACDTDASDYQRTVAIQALVELDDKPRLLKFAKAFLANAADLSASLAARAASALYPKAISTDDLLNLIARSHQPNSNSIEGFAYEVHALYIAATSRAEKAKLIAGLADLCLLPPFVQPYHRISERFGYLASLLRPIARAEILALNGEPSDGLVRLLMAVERADRHYPADDDDSLPLRDQVQRHLRLNRALMWADVAEKREHAPSDERPIIHSWQIFFTPGEVLWHPTGADISWLTDDVSNKENIDDRRMALSALVSALAMADRLQNERDCLYTLVDGVPDLISDLNAYFAPRPDNDERRRWDHDREKRRRKQEARTADDKASWIEFADSLRADPAMLSRFDNLVSWKAGVFRLKHLTYWLQQRAKAYNHVAPREWRLLEEGFGRSVAEAYRDGMMALWRITKPERPVRKPGGMVTSKWLQILAFAGIGVESRETGDWPNQLNDEAIAIATRHAIYSNEPYPDWLDGLVLRAPATTLPIIKRELTWEWAATERGHTDFFYHYGSPEVVLTQPLQQALVKVIGAREAGSSNTLDNAVAIVRKLELPPKQRERLFKNIHQRFSEHAASHADQFALRNLAVLFMLDASSALSVLIDWVGKERPEPGVTRVANVIATLFDGHHRSLAVGALADLPLSGLEKLLSFTYKHIRPQDDYDHVGSYSPDTRDNAQTARNTILSQLLDRPGPDAYRSVLRLAEEPEFVDRSERYRELAHSKAEKDSEFPAWTSSEVLTFERQHTAPIKTGADLLLVVMNVLADITFHLAKGDVSSRPLLQRAQDENEARNWIAEQVFWRAKGRFHVYRETEVAKRDRPDIVIASASAPCEVAIEVKHGDKGWTIANLEHALRSQLAEDYLKPASRRHGVLIVTNHSLRQWIDRSTRQKLSFEDLIARLSSIANTVLLNTSGAIEVRCVGIDAAWAV